MGVTEPTYHRHGMETRQRVSVVEHSAAPHIAQADAFLAAVRHEHARFMDALGQAAAMLGRQSEQLQPAAAAQVQLTRQFLDAQRSILQLRAATDNELALIGVVPDDGVESAATHHDEVLAAQRQRLATALDGWWAQENALSRTVTDEARDAVQSYLGRLATIELCDAAARPDAVSRVFAGLEVGDPVDLGSLLGELIRSLDTQAVEAVATVEQVADPGDLHFVEMGASEAFGEFWVRRAAGESLAAAPVRQRRLLPQALYPVAVVASLLTIAMAWMG